MREKGLEDLRQQRRRAIEEAISRRQEARQFVRREQEKVRLTRLTVPVPREAQFLNAAGAIATLVTVGGLRGYTGIVMYVSYRWMVGPEPCRPSLISSLSFSWRRRGDAVAFDRDGDGGNIGEGGGTAQFGAPESRQCGGRSEGQEGVAVQLGDTSRRSVGQMRGKWQGFLRGT